MCNDLSIENLAKSTHCHESAAQTIANMTLMKQPKVIRLAITNDAKTILTAFAASTGMKEIALASRIFQWWGEQPEDFQRAMLGLYGKRTPDIAKLALEEMANSTRKDAETGEAPMANPKSSSRSASPMRAPVKKQRAG